MPQLDIITYYSQILWIFFINFNSYILLMFLLFVIFISIKKNVLNLFAAITLLFHTDSNILNQLFFYSKKTNKNDEKTTIKN